MYAAALVSSSMQTGALITVMICPTGKMAQSKFFIAIELRFSIIEYHKRLQMAIMNTKHQRLPTKMGIFIRSLDLEVMQRDYTKASSEEKRSEQDLYSLQLRKTNLNTLRLQILSFGHVVTRLTQLLSVILIIKLSQCNQKYHSPSVT